MKKLILLCFLLIAFEANAQNTFLKAYGDNKWEYAAYMQQTSDSGYLITGSKTNNFGPLDVYLMKIDANGNQLWNKNFGGSAADAGFKSDETSDGGYVIAANTYSYGMGMEDAFMLKTDSNGNLQWSKVMGTSQYDGLLAVKQTYDGGIIFAGFYNTGLTKVFLVKTNILGDTLWTRTIGSIYPLIGESLQLTPDGGFIITGSSHNSVYLLKTDSIGMPVWAKTYGGTVSDVGHDVQKTADGGFIITGQTYFGAGNTDVYLIKTDSTGNALWSKTYGGADYEAGLAVQQTSDGGYIVSGFTTPTIGDYDIYIIKTDSTGDTLWTKTIILPSSTSGGCKIMEASNGGYVIASDADGFIGGNSNDLLLIKIDSTGNSSCNTGNISTTVTSPPTQVSTIASTVSSAGIITQPAPGINSGNVILTTVCQSTSVFETYEPAELLNLYPNPSTGKFFISSGSSMTVQVAIMNVFGREVFSKKSVDLSELKPIPFSLSLPGGIYFLKLSDGEKSYCRKIIIE